MSVWSHAPIYYDLQHVPTVSNIYIYIYIYQRNCRSSHQETSVSGFVEKAERCTKFPRKPTSYNSLATDSRWPAVTPEFLQLCKVPRSSRSWRDTKTFLAFRWMFSTIVERERERERERGEERRGEGKRDGMRNRHTRRLNFDDPCVFQ